MVDVRTVCLGLLLDGEASGYEIKKKLEDGHFAKFLEASFGSIYPALNRLTEQGYVEFRTEEQDGRPDKKIYAITQTGRLYFMDQLSDAPADDKIRSDFLFHMIFSDLIAPQRVSELVDAQIAQYRHKLQTIETFLRDAAAEGKPLNACTRFVADYGRTLCLATIQYLEDNRHLVEREALLGTAHSAPAPQPSQLA